MLASTLIRSLRNNIVPISSAISYQQIRFSKKSFRLRYGYGEEPLITDDEFDQAKEDNRLEDLSYKEVRFALPWENNSPLFDREYEKFCRYIMKGGRKDLAHDLMHRTFYRIKSIQYNSLRKVKEKLDGDSTLSLEDIENMAIKSLPGDDESINQEASTKIELNPLIIFRSALKNCEPYVITKKVKRGGATYQVPYPLSREQSEYYAIKWIIGAVLDRPKPRKKLFPEVMAQELLDAHNGRGKVIKKRDDIHKLAAANKAYAHYSYDHDS